MYLNILVANVSLKRLRNGTRMDTTLSVVQEKKICLDLVCPLKPTKKGYSSLRTVVDVYTRWFTAWPVKNQKAEMVIKHLIRDYIPERGVPAVVHSDNGPAYIAHVFKVAMAAMTSGPPPLPFTIRKAT